MGCTLCQVQSPCTASLLPSVLGARRAGECWPRRDPPDRSLIFISSLWPRAVCPEQPHSLFCLSPGPVFLRGGGGGVLCSLPAPHVLRVPWNRRPCLGQANATCPWGPDPHTHWADPYEEGSQVAVAVTVGSEGQVAEQHCSECEPSARRPSAQLWRSSGPCRLAQYCQEDRAGARPGWPQARAQLGPQSGSATGRRGVPPDPAPLMKGAVGDNISCWATAGACTHRQPPPGTR